MSDESSPFGDWLQAEIDRRGWSNAEFARRADVPPQTSWRWLRAGNKPDAEFWPKIGHALGYPIDRIGRAVQGFPTTTTATVDAIDHRLQQLLEDQSSLLRYVNEARSIPEGVKIPIIGYIPADAIRWTTSDGQGTVDVLHSDLRGADSPFALIAAGDCMMRAGIVSGTIVILDRPNGREPRNGQIVAVRVNADEYTLKRWVVVSGGVELHDGDGNVIYKLNPLDEVDVIGHYVTHKPGVDT